MIEEDFQTWWKCFPINRKIKINKAKGVFPFLLKKYGLEHMVAKTKAFTQYHKDLKTEVCYIPHPMTWINDGGLDENLQEKEEAFEVRKPFDDKDNPEYWDEALKKFKSTDTNGAYRKWLMLGSHKMIDGYDVLVFVNKFQREWFKNNHAIHFGNIIKSLGGQGLRVIHKDEI